MKSTIHDIGSIEGITFNVVLNLLFSVPFNVGLELGQFHRKIITKQLTLEEGKAGTRAV